MIQYCIIIIQCNIYLLLVCHSVIKGGAGLYRIKLLLVIKNSAIKDVEKS